MSDQAENITPTEKTETQSTDRRTTLSLKNLFLDPNNYRFIDDETYVYVNDKDVTNQEIQKRTYRLVIGKNAENIKDLVDSFKKNGYLPVDQIQVRKISDSGKYLVVEGNRRVATLKYLENRYQQNVLDLGKLESSIFTKVPVITYQEADDIHHLVLMGLKHISGNKKWPAINQAQLIRTLYEKHEMPIDDICKSIGISKIVANTTLQTLYLIDIYKNSDYGNEFESSKFSVFLEIIRNKNLRNWIGWDASIGKAKNQKNLDRLFSWISKEPIIDNEEIEEDTDAIVEHTRSYEPVLVKSAQIRELAKIIDDEHALANLDRTRSLTEATLSSETVGKNRVIDAITVIDQEIGVLFNMFQLVGDADRAKITTLNKKLSGLLHIEEKQSISGTSRSVYVETNGGGFSEINIKHFRRIKNIKLNNLKRINIIAGINNSGKTTLLEGVKLLCSLNQSEEFIRVICRRAKIASDQVDIRWFLDQIPIAEIDGIYSGKFTNLKIVPEDVSLEDMTQYLKSVRFEAIFNSKSYKSVIHFFEKYPRRTEGYFASICPSVFSSPFSGLEPELLNDCHAKSLKEGSKQKIIDFINNNIDTNILNIEQDDRGHFTVIHKSIAPNPDLTKFGEGLQRIFKIGLLFAGARNGVVIIDEFENAIHFGLLNKVANLLLDLAIKFNVQVFISSHSKECIDAFASNNAIPKSDISAHSLIEKNGELICQSFSGERLSSLIESIDFDLRGGK